MGALPCDKCLIMKLNWSFVLALPFFSVFALFFVIPLLLTFIVSFWDYTEYSIIPDFIWTNYHYIFSGCFEPSADLCLTFRTYASTLFYCFFAWLLTLIIGFTVAFFLAFHVRSLPLQIGLFLICTIPFGRRTSYGWYPGYRYLEEMVYLMNFC